MNDSIVSVIVPVFNVQKYLNQCLASIVKQDYKNLEIILVNDGSTDNSPMICKQWAKNDSRIKIVNQKNAGLAAARNSGLKVSNGKYVVFVDSDDWLDKRMISTMVNAFTKYNADMVICQFNIVKNNGLVNISYNAKKQVKIIDQKAFVQLLLKDEEVTNQIWRKMFKKSLLPSRPFRSGHNFEDIEAMPRLIEKCKSFVCLSQPLYFYRMRSLSIIHNLSDSNIIDYAEAVNSSLSKYRRMFPELSRYINNTHFIKTRDLLSKIIANGGMNESSKLVKLQEEALIDLKSMPVKEIIRPNDKVFWVGITFFPKITIFNMKTRLTIHAKIKKMLRG